VLLRLQGLAEVPLGRGDIVQGQTDVSQRVAAGPVTLLGFGPVGHGGGTGGGDVEGLPERRARPGQIAAANAVVARGVSMIDEGIPGRFPRGG
jgi:hypothetical protein